MFTVIFDYYEYSDTGEYLGENTDCLDFLSKSAATEYLNSIITNDDVKKAWIESHELQHPAA